MKNNKILINYIIVLLVFVGCKKNTEPVALFSISPASGPANTEFIFDASESYDEEDNSSSLMIRWDWEDDANWDTEFTTDKIAKHIFPGLGSYSIKLEVKDLEALSSFVTRSLEVSSGNFPPSTPSLPKPTTNSDSIETYIELGWKSIDPEGEELNFDIYLGTEADPPLVVSDWDSLSYQTDILIIDTTYNWKIIAKDNYNNFTEGPVWSFKTNLKQYDLRDGKSYQAVRIGHQYWMAENMNYETGIGSICYAEDFTACDVYGRLYHWESAINACPDGWHLPSDEEWKTLERELGMHNSWIERVGLRGTNEGKKLKSASGWVVTIEYPDPNGNNLSGFNALPAGTIWTDGSYDGIGFTTRFWTSTENSSVYAYYRVLYSYSTGILRTFNIKTDYFSVRCLRD